MTKYIEKIEGKIPNTSSEVLIDIDGKNLIITGINGSGKTSLLLGLHSKTQLLIVQKYQADLPKLLAKYEQTEFAFSHETKGTNRYDQLKSTLTNIRKKIDGVRGGLKITIRKNIEFSGKVDDKHAVVRMFGANRAANILHADTAKGVETAALRYDSLGTEKNMGEALEQHLVNLKNRRSLALSEDHDVQLADKIEKWLNTFEKSLKILMEDDSTELGFNSNTLKFSINQNGKPPYTFQTLSSGYLAIFDIYADLIMRVEYSTISAEELTGVVFIDEIDAHLHVSLQRLIMPFLVDSFPKIQFIVTTHSPFVLTSLSDVVIYDIGKNSQMNENISFLPYTAVMEGLLGTKTTSIAAENTILEISKLVNSESIDYERLEILVDRITPIEDKLDKQSRVFYLLGRNKLLDKEE